jgi:hypothetical protein
MYRMDRIGWSVGCWIAEALRGMRALSLLVCSRKGAKLSYRMKPTMVGWMDRMGLTMVGWMLDR